MNAKEIKSHNVKIQAKMSKIYSLILECKKVRNTNHRRIAKLDTIYAMLKTSLI